MFTGCLLLNCQDLWWPAPTFNVLYPFDLIAIPFFFCVLDHPQHEWGYALLDPAAATQPTKNPTPVQALALYPLPAIVCLLALSDVSVRLIALRHSVRGYSNVNYYKSTKCLYYV